MVVVLAVATIIEHLYGTAAGSAIYHSWPFVGLWMSIALTGSWAMWRSRLHRRPPVLMLHVALLLILVGAAITHFTSENGKLQLAAHESAHSFVDTCGVEHFFPLEITLRRFDIQYYAGTPAPMDFVSELIITFPDGKKMESSVRMNKVVSCRGYRFYQSGFDADGGGTILAVAHDPWGIAVTYCGYALLFLGMVATLMSRESVLRRMLRSPVLRVGAVTLAAAVAFQSYAGEPRTVSREVARRMGDLYVLHNNRICPLQTQACDFITKLYGKSSYRELSAEQVLSGWLFYFDDWKQEPVIKVKSARVRRLLEAEGRYVPLTQFADSHNGYRLDTLLRKVYAGEEKSDVRGILEADEKYELAMLTASARNLKLLPLRYHGSLEWFEPASLDVPTDIPDEQWAFMRNGLGYLCELVAMGDNEGALAFIDALRRYQERELGTAAPSVVAFRAEKAYNRAVPYVSLVAMLLVTLGILLMAVTARQLAQKKALPRWCLGTGVVVACAVASYVLLCFVLRWVVSGHVPLSNGFETMQFLALVALLATVALMRRWPSMLAFGLLLVGLSLMVSWFGQANPAITPLMPVLHSPLLSLHVVLIMLAYALLAFMMLNGIMAFCVRKQRAQVARLQVMSLAMLEPAVALLAAGIFIGAVWANVSWGTYWSWDPKEVWALITLIIYALPLHHARWLSGHPLRFHAYAVLAFTSVLITYFGVNFVLGGMHSYA